MSSKLAKFALKSTITKENWGEKKRKLKEKFPHLTDLDLNFVEGKMENLINNLHNKIGKTIGKSKEGLLKFVELI